jgi:hypothetical protein
MLDRVEIDANFEAAKKLDKQGKWINPLQERLNELVANQNRTEK